MNMTPKEAHEMAMLTLKAQRATELNHALHKALYGMMGQEVEFNGHRGKLLSTSNGIAVLENVPLYFDFGNCYFDGIPTINPNYCFVLPEHMVTPITGGCTCHIDPAQCCDRD